MKNSTRYDVLALIEAPLFLSTLWVQQTIGYFTHTGVREPYVELLSYLNLGTLAIGHRHLHRTCQGLWGITSSRISRIVLDCHAHALFATMWSFTGVKIAAGFSHSVVVTEPLFGQQQEIQ